MSERLDELKKRLKAYDRVGTVSMYSALLGGCGMAVSYIWQWEIASRISTCVTSVGLLVTLFMLISYTGCKGLIEEENKKPSAPPKAAQQ